MTEYVTTNIRLPKAMYERIKRVAQQTNKSFAQVIRESVVEYLIASQPPAAVGGDEDFDDPIYHLADLASAEEVVGGDRPTDTSARHDYYLYGVEHD
jgi:hypothetical protein